MYKKESQNWRCSAGWWVSWTLITVVNKYARKCIEMVAECRLSDGTTRSVRRVCNMCSYFLHVSLCRTLSLSNLFLFSCRFFAPTMKLHFHTKKKPRLFISPPISNQIRDNHKEGGIAGLHSCLHKNAGHPTIFRLLSSGFPLFPCCFTSLSHRSPSGNNSQPCADDG